MGLLKPKQVMESPDYSFGLCLWKLPHGGYIMNKDQDYLNCFGKLNDHVIEARMREAALQMGVTDGKPFWLPGFRRVSQSEWEDQMERLMDGKTPDIVDVYRSNRG